MHFILVTQWHSKGLRESSVLAHSTYHCLFTAIMCVTEGHQRSSCDAATAITPRFYCLFIRTQRHVACFVHDQSTRRRMSLLATQRRRIMQMPLRCCAAEGESSLNRLKGVHTLKENLNLFLFDFFFQNAMPLMHCQKIINKFLELTNAILKEKAQATSSSFFVEDEAKK